MIERVIWILLHVFPYKAADGMVMVDICGDQSSAKRCIMSTNKLTTTGLKGQTSIEELILKELNEVEDGETLKEPQIEETKRVILELNDCSKTVSIEKVYL